MVSLSPVVSNAVIRYKEHEPERRGLAAIQSAVPEMSVEIDLVQEYVELRTAAPRRRFGPAYVDRHGRGGVVSSERSCEARSWSLRHGGRDRVIGCSHGQRKPRLGIPAHSRRIVESGAQTWSEDDR